MDKARILVVEDEEDILNMEAKGINWCFECDIDKSLDGADAIDRLKFARYDLVILDITMPQKSGIDVIKEIKKMQDQPEILVVTGQRNPRLLNEMFGPEPAVYLEKPVIIDELKEAVRALLIKRGKYFPKDA